MNYQGPHVMTKIRVQVQETILNAYNYSLKVMSHNRERMYSEYIKDHESYQ